VNSALHVQLIRRGDSGVEDIVTIGVPSETKAF
jgi:hypothetical protein